MKTELTNEELEVAALSADSWSRGEQDGDCNTNFDF